MSEDGIPRIYTSFAEFERDELRRLGLTAWPTPVAAASVVVEPPVAGQRAAEPVVGPVVPVPVLPVLVPVLPALPVLPPAVSLVPAPARTTVTPTTLRAEGILEIGRVQGTSVLFVQTRAKLHLFHSTWLPDRQLDDYAVNLAVTWIEGHGLPSCTVANNLGVSETTLRNALTKAGYERLSPAQHAALAVARSARKLGNRRGRLVRATTNTGAHA